MTLVEDFPHRVVEHTDMGIRLPDGTRLSARVWLPEGADENPVPAILEYLPYRKTDGTLVRDQGMHPYFAGHGYACLRVDRRGCGDSEGLFDDEYSPQELQDGVDIIAWIANQPWCSGAVGIQGISWGGFNGLQIAALKPPALKAVITIGTTVDRYADDIHYKGGIQLTENIGWAATVLSWFSMPPDPAIVGDKWREMWLERLENTPFLAETWLRHRDRDAYWKHGSVCEDFAAIEAPVLAIGGYLDGYRNAMAHLAENLPGTVKAIAGPWGHKYPHISHIEPAMGYLQEALRWWDQWLKGIDTGVEDDPAYRAYVMDSVVPSVSQSERPGVWLAEAAWPPTNVQAHPVMLGDADIPFDLACGRGCGEYFTFGFGPGELPGDQQQDDARSACFDFDPPPGETVLLGRAGFRARVRSDQPAAQLIVRLCDLRPDGTSALIAHGMLDLRRRDSMEHPSDMPIGEDVTVAIDLDQCAYRLPEGHRLRLALSSSYWPFVWPEATPVHLAVTDAQVTLPVRSGPEIPWNAPPPESARPRRRRILRPGEETKEWTKDAQGRSVLTIASDEGEIEDLENGLIATCTLKEVWTLDESDPSSAHVRIDWTRGMARGDWSVRTETSTEMQATATGYEASYRLEAFEGEDRVFVQKFNATVPR
ncbi:MAG: CocE/NonD family hydrolase [Alphaproteobacteria bacterium]|nr:CocE/NonD family hydrolase [Alphaproteobacteria bacterium]